MDRYFLQLVGTIKATPPYANLFMGGHEETTWEAFVWEIPLWKRFIDDISLIFLGTIEQLQSMSDFMSKLNPTIKFTIEHSIRQISFLDIKIHMGADHSQQTCTENPLTVPEFYTSTPTAHSNAKRTLFSRILSDTAF